VEFASQSAIQRSNVTLRIPLKAISHSGVFDQVWSEAAERPTQRSGQPLEITSFENIVG